MSLSLYRGGLLYGCNIFCMFSPVDIPYYLLFAMPLRELFTAA